MKFKFPQIEIPQSFQTDKAFTLEAWSDWRWQMRQSLRTLEDFQRHFTDLTEDEKAALQPRGEASQADDGKWQFETRTTPYYAALALNSLRLSEVSSECQDHQQIECGGQLDPLRRILLPTSSEWQEGYQHLWDPLNEKQNNPAPRIVHRYPDRVLFLVTDTCSVYCRYCTRKHFTASRALSVVQGSDEYEQALSYIRNHPGIREVILSGGDPLVMSDAQLVRIVRDIRSIDHIEIIRIGTRMPVVCPMRVTPELVDALRAFHPIYIMNHFNHPRELTEDSVRALTLFANAGFPLMNQLVLLNGINNHPAIIQALSRRLLYLRVKPYYMFQCDPSRGTDHLRTSVQNSLNIQRELWGRLSGLAMPQLALDLPGGGGKVGLVPDFSLPASSNDIRHFCGWDGIKGQYVSPPEELMKVPADAHLYEAEWQSLINAKLACEQSN